MGLGVLAKGVGFLAMLALVPWSLARLRAWRRVGNGPGRWWTAGPLVMLLVIAAWLVPLKMRAAGSADPTLAVYLQDLLFGQTVDRYVRPSGHLRPPWYFLGALAWA